MIQSLLIANRGEIACRIVRTQILPGTGRGTTPKSLLGVVEGTHLSFAAQTSPWDPSDGYVATSPCRGGIDPSVRASPCYLPVSGRI
jgi:hypothetical protein